MRKTLIKFYERTLIKTTPFAIISDNCWGADSYSSLNRPYNTPFVGLYILPDDYLRLLSKFDQIFDAKLSFKDRSKYFDCSSEYPIGVILDDIEIHFLHYPNEKVASEKWQRRLQRLQTYVSSKQSLFIKFCGNRHATPQHVLDFHNKQICLNNNSISFSAFVADHPKHLKNETLRDKNGEFANGVKLFRYRYSMFDFAKWLTTKTISTSLFSKIISLGKK